jgi:hypothetical protein
VHFLKTFALVQAIGLTDYLYTHLASQAFGVLPGNLQQTRTVRIVGWDLRFPVHMRASWKAERHCSACLHRLQETGLHGVLDLVTSLFDDFWSYTTTACAMPREISMYNETLWLRQRLDAAVGVRMQQSGYLNQMAHLMFADPQYKFVQVDELYDVVDTRGGSITQVSCLRNG